MRKIYLVLVLSLAVSTSALKADTIRVFAIEDRAGAISPGGAHNLYSILSGIIAIDTTTGVGLFGDIQYDLYRSQLDQPFNPPLTMQIVSNATNYGCLNNCDSFPNGHQMQFVSDNPDGSSFFAWISTPTGLVNYTGGDLCYIAGQCEGDAYTYFGYVNFSFPPYTIDGTPYPGGVITGTDTFFTGRLVQVGEYSTPEPATWILLGTGALGLLTTAKRRLLPS